MKLLHIVASPRAAESNTLRISDKFLESLRDKHSDVDVDTVNAFSEDLPPVARANVDTKYDIMSGLPIAPARAASWKQIEALIDQFMAADVYLVSTPMWNFSIPGPLKGYIDAIVQPGYLFTYDAQGYPVGLCQGKKMICITTRGGDYSPGGPMHAYDLQEPYLRAIFGFVGITDVNCLHAQPMDVTPQLREEAMKSGIEAARELADTLTW